MAFGGGSPRVPVKLWPIPGAEKRRSHGGLPFRAFGLFGIFLGFRVKEGGPGILGLLRFWGSWVYSPGTLGLEELIGELYYKGPTLSYTSPPPPSPPPAPKFVHAPPFLIVSLRSWALESSGGLPYGPIAWLYYDKRTVCSCLGFRVWGRCPCTRILI